MSASGETATDRPPPRRTGKGYARAAWTLALLSPAFGEVLPGAKPPLQFPDPVGMGLLAAFYASGALVARELMVGWRKGWASLLCLAAAYGIVEEGLAVKSFFDPAWVDLGPAGSYGRFLGVNWVWSVQLTVYHAVFSILVPVLLATLIHRDLREEAWISRRAFRGLGALFAGLTVFYFLLLTPYRPPPVQYLMTVLLVVGLWRLARLVPHPLLPPLARPTPSPRAVAGLGFLGAGVFIAMGWLLPYTPVPALGAVLITLGWVGLIAWLLARLTGNGAAWGDRHRLALAAGTLGFYILTAPLQETDPRKRGMSLVGLAAAALLLWLARRLRAGHSSAGRQLPPGTAPV